MGGSRSDGGSLLHVKRVKKKKAKKAGEFHAAVSGKPIAWGWKIFITSDFNS